jgi:hypothetical protein
VKIDYNQQRWKLEESRTVTKNPKPRGEMKAPEKATQIYCRHENENTSSTNRIEKPIFPLNQQDYIESMEVTTPPPLFDY